MKKKIIYSIVFSVVILLLVFINDYMSYSIRIGDTQLYFVETMAMSEDGEPLMGLFCKTMKAGYKGVEMGGFPRAVLWNDKYLISKNHNGKDTTINSYVIINQDSINEWDGSISDIHKFKDAEEYHGYLREISLSESNMKKVDNHVKWWQMLFK